MVKDDIAYQNKDITSKVLTEYFREKSLNVYGLNLPKVVELQPTDLPAISLNELRLDQLLMFADGTVGIVDYESVYRREDMITYANYLVRVAERYRKQGRAIPKIHMIVIYTADVKREQVDPDLDCIGFSVHIETAFLSELDSQEIYQRLKEKVSGGLPLTEDEIMEFIILPLSVPGKQRKQELVANTVEIAAQIRDVHTSNFVLAGLFSFCDKVMTEETQNKVKELIRMTAIDKLYEEEKEAALAEMAAENKAALAEMAAENKAALAEMAAEKKAALAEKDKIIAEKDEALARMDVKSKTAFAEKMAQAVELFAAGLRIPIPEACERMKYPYSEYTTAIQLLKRA